MSMGSIGTAGALRSFVPYRSICALLVACGLAPLAAATLEKLSLDEMIAQSTSIVRGRIVSATGVFHGPLIYTHFKIQVTERYKGPSGGTEEFMVPGGSANGYTQDVAGAPDLSAGRDYVLFLWKGPSGNTHIIGLTQGVFTLPTDSTGDPTATRILSTELMIDRATGQAVKDDRLSLKLSDLKSRIKLASATGAAQ
jgi:hypothetical protein